MKSAIEAYQAFSRVTPPTTTASSSFKADIGDSSANSFGHVLDRTLSDAIQTGHTAEQQAAEGLSGHGDITHIVTAVSDAQMALQTTTVLRDRFAQAYQDIMRMSI